MSAAHADTSRKREDQPELLTVELPSGRPPGGPRGGLSFVDVIGGRVLAWVGGATTLLGVVFFLMLAVSRGWIGVEARVAMAGLGSAALVGVGVWLHDRRARTEASLTMVGAGAAGLFATWVVAGQVYGLVSPYVAVGGSLMVGALTTSLAIRWRARTIGALGLLGALLSPVLVGAPHTALAVAILAVAAACAMAVVIHQGWNWLGVAAVLVSAPQWLAFLLRPMAVGPSGITAVTLTTGIALAVVGWFAALGLAGAVGAARLAEGSTPSHGMPAGVALAALSGCLTAAAGYVALTRIADQTTGELWLALVATVHLVAGVGRLPWLNLPAGLRRVLISLGVLAADAAFALAAHGLIQSVGWVAGGIAFGWLVRRALAASDTDGADRALLGAGLGGHLALTLVQALTSLPPDMLHAPDTPVSGFLSVALLAAGCLACGELIGPRATLVRRLLNRAGVAAIAYLTIGTLAGSALVAAWALEGAALIQLARRQDDPLALPAGLAFLGLAGLHATVVEAPPIALLTGAASLRAAAEALGVLIIALLSVAWREAVRWRPWLLVAAGAALYLISVTIITAFQPAAGTDFSMVLDLTVRQQGQVLLSACWGTVGVAGLILGLRRNTALVRDVALGLLLLTIGKVFLYDLSTLTSVYRVASFIGLGLLLLGGAFAYQRLRPPPLPDMRSVARAER
ncbi:MAG: hypothetical protein QOF83_1643 [Solirubrobacteraceae bacterium]|nr:hypothetical protein [Solirubrobacteraceae bacterium]